MEYIQINVLLKEESFKNKRFRALLNNNFKLLESSYNNIIDLNNYKQHENEIKIIEIDKSNYTLFKKLHDGVDIFWNVDRLYNNLDKWEILYCDSKNIQGAIYCMKNGKLWEIFGIDFSDNKYHKSLSEELIICICNRAKEAKVSHLVYFVETKRECSVLKNIGFSPIDKYCYFEISK